MINKITRVVQYCFTTLLLVFFLGTEKAYARGGYEGSYSAGGFSNVSRGVSGTRSSLVLSTPESAYKLLQCLAVFVLALLPIAFYREISNLIRFWGQEFTSDPELVEFTKSIHPRFTNTYSVKFFRNGERWRVIPLAPALPEAEYQDFISKQQLFQGIFDLFIRYQHDWTQKNFELMSKYLNTPFYEQQSDLFQRAFREGYDIVYHPKANEVIPVNYGFRDNAHFFRVQINAEMVNFSLSHRGTVLSGTTTVRQFTEYWDIRVDSDGQFYLLDINLWNLDELEPIESLPAPQKSGLDRVGDKLLQLIYH